VCRYVARPPLALDRRSRDGDSQQLEFTALIARPRTKGAKKSQQDDQYHVPEHSILRSGEIDTGIRKYSRIVLPEELYDRRRNAPQDTNYHPFPACHRNLFNGCGVRHGKSPMCKRDDPSSVLAS